MLLASFFLALSLCRKTCSSCSYSIQCSLQDFWRGRCFSLLSYFFGQLGPFPRRRFRKPYSRWYQKNFVSPPAAGKQQLKKTFSLHWSCMQSGHQKQNRRGELPIYIRTIYFNQAFCHHLWHIFTDHGSCIWQDFLINTVNVLNLLLSALGCFVDRCMQRYRTEDLLSVQKTPSIESEISDVYEDLQDVNRQIARNHQTSDTIYQWVLVQGVVAFWEPPFLCCVVDLPLKLVIPHVTLFVLQFDPRMHSMYNSLYLGTSYNLMLFWLTSRRSQYCEVYSFYGKLKSLFVLSPSCFWKDGRRRRRGRWSWRWRRYLLEHGSSRRWRVSLWRGQTWCRIGFSN